MALNPELEKYYEERIAMFASKGWKDFIEDIHGMEKSTNDISGIQDEKTLHFRRGEMSIMRWLLSLEEMSRKSFEDLKNEDA